MRYDVVIAGGGHNGLVAAAYLARAGRRVLVLERLDHIGGLTVSAKAFPGVDARLSRYSYLVSLLPTKIVKDLGLSLELRRRRVASYTPIGDTGLLIDNADPARTAASFTRTGSSDLNAWNDFHTALSRLAARVAPTLLEPLPSRTALRKTIDDDTAWHDLFERPIGQVIDDRFGSDLIRGIVLTDALTTAFTGTFRVNESASQLATAFDRASRGLIPDLPPSEIYCHSLTDDSIFGPSLRETGAQTLTLFGLCMPARLFTTPEAKELAVARAIASINTVLAEPIENCLLTTPDGQPCLEAKTPLDLERDVALPGGHIFHGDLSWPYAEDDHGPWGVETEHPRILRCGASARRGGGVSGIPGHNAAMAALG
ncbi:NAD(P)-binding protein [Acrocarpospora sp. B8E8]|uniref:phytoene desaturase family protein n=1 Tax=Acrocarpospora sp. B8E8 TaxID=3153572 RepID=UPI00325E86CF